MHSRDPLANAAHGRSSEGGTSRAFPRPPLFVIGVVGLIAGVLVARQMTTAPAFAAEPTTLATAATPAAGAPPIITAPTGTPTSPSTPGSTRLTEAAPAKAGDPIVFLDSRPAATDPAAPAPPPTSSGGFMRVVMMLTILGGGALAWFLLRRRQGRTGASPSTSLSLMGSLRVAGRWQVALVKVPGKTLVLGATEKGLTLLSELDEDAILETASDEPHATSSPADRRARPRQTDADELLARVRDEDSLSVGPTAPRTTGERVTTQRGHGAPPTLSNDPFGRLLDQLARGDSRPSARPTDAAAQRYASDRPSTSPNPDTYLGPLGPRTSAERMKTPEAQALRARLERHQAPN